MKHTDGNKGQVPAKKQVNSNPNPNPNLKPGPNSNSPAGVKAIKQEAEQNEVAGRHKNDGQMGHKGAR